jgi:hypothetical protein
MRHRALLDAIAAGPPRLPDAGARFFNADLLDLSRDALLEEQFRLQLRLRLTGPVERERWPATWVAERLAAVEDLLQVQTVAAGWQKVR